MVETVALFSCNWLDDLKMRMHKKRLFEAQGYVEIKVMLEDL